MPNLLTFIRLFSVPVFVVLILSASPSHKLLGVVLFALAALTDWLDGWLARATDRVTKLGTVLDPLTDRLLIIAAGGCVFYLRELPFWPLMVLLIREFIVISGYVFLRSRNLELKVSWTGKTATAFLLASIFVLLLDQVLIRSWVSLTGQIIFYLGLILYIIAALDYLKKGINLTREGRGTRSTEENS